MPGQSAKRSTPNGGVQTGAPAPIAPANDLAETRRRNAASRALSAEQFHTQHNTGFPGASMGAKSGRVYSDGDPGFFVGGHPGKDGKPLESVQMKAGSWGPAEVQQQRSRVLATAKSPSTVALGSWDQDGHTHWDASTIFNDRTKAVNAGFHRNQIAIWDNGSGEEIPTGGTGSGPKKYRTESGMHPGSWRGSDFGSKPARSTEFSSGRTGIPSIMDSVTAAGNKARDHAANMKRLQSAVGLG